MYSSQTWTRFAQGRTLVGVDTSNSNFNTVEKTGGYADSAVITHTHSVSGSAATGGGHSHGTGNSTLAHFQIQQNSKVSRRNIGSSGKGYQWTTDSTSNYSAVSAVSATSSHSGHTHGVSGTASAPSNAVAGTGRNLQPYVTVYYWKRTA